MIITNIEVMIEISNINIFFYSDHKYGNLVHPIVSTKGSN